MGLLQGVFGNLSEVSSEALVAEYGAYLMDGERISVGFKLIRDAVIFTDRRIISIDKQGTTGQKKTDQFDLSEFGHRCFSRDSGLWAG